MPTELTDNLLWLDLETTGSDETKGDCIIEVGCILTTSNLETISEYSTVVSPRPLGLGRMMQNPVAREMHEKNGLLAEVLAVGDTHKIHFVTIGVMTWLRTNGAQSGKVVLAGSGVGHFDRRFINAEMPQLASTFLRYWCIDVGVIRRAHEMWLGDDPFKMNDGKTHRALDDARCHLEEARAFRKLWRYEHEAAYAHWRDSQE